MDYSPYIFIGPFLLLGVILALFAWTGIGEWQVRHPKSRHRGRYEDSLLPFREAAALEEKIARGIASSRPTLPNEPSVGAFVWEGTVMFGTFGQAETPSTATMTIEPSGGLLTIPALLGNPSPSYLTIDDVMEWGERQEAERAERASLALESAVESLIQRHERIYHPVPV